MDLKYPFFLFVLRRNYGILIKIFIYLFISTAQISWEMLYFVVYLHSRMCFHYPELSVMTKLAVEPQNRTDVTLAESWDEQLLDVYVPKASDC